MTPVFPLYPAWDFTLCCSPSWHCTSLEKGLLPKNVVIASHIKRFPLELGLLVSGSLVVSGTIAAGWAATHWAEIGFGSLNPEETMLVFIPCIGTIVAGAQIFFFISLLDLLEMGQT